MFPMKSRNPVGRAFTDVCVAFPVAFPFPDPLFQLVGLFPTFGDSFFAPMRAKNLVRQAPLRKGIPRGVPFRARFEIRLGPPWGALPRSLPQRSCSLSRFPVVANIPRLRVAQPPRKYRFHKGNTPKSVHQIPSGSVCATGS